MPPAAGRDGVSTEALRFAGAKTPQADGLRRVQDTTRSKCAMI